MSIPDYGSCFCPQLEDGVLRDPGSQQTLLTEKVGKVNDLQTPVFHFRSGPNEHERNEDIRRRKTKEEIQKNILINY